MKKVTDKKTASCGRDARTTTAAARVISVVAILPVLLSDHADPATPGRLSRPGMLELMSMQAGDVDCGQSDGIGMI